MGYGRLARGHKRRVAGAVASYAARRISGFKRPRANTRLAHRNVRSRTRTSTKKKKRVGKTIGPVAGHDTSYFFRKLRNRFVSRKCIKGAPFYYSLNQGAAFQSTAGKQGVTDFGGNELGTGIDLSALWNNMATRTATASVAGVVENILATNNGSAKILVHEMSMEATFTNTSNVGVWLTIYDTTNRFKTVLSSTFGVGAANTWLEGIAEEDGGVQNYLSVGQTPFMSHAFCTNYKILKSTKVYINPGHIHKHTMKIMINKTLSADELSTAPLTGGTGILTTFNALPLWTYWPMIAFYGSPIHSLASPTTVSVPAVQLDCVWVKKYKFSYYQNNLTQFTFGQDLATTIADPHTVPEDTGVDTAVVQN